MNVKLINIMRNSNFESFQRVYSSRINVTRIKRSIYPIMYMVDVVRPDGAIQRIRFHEPRQLIQFPLDINKCSEAERRKRLILRSPPSKLNVEEDVSIKFDVNEYSYLWKKK